MAWIWESLEEFKEHIQPVAIQAGRFRHASRTTELDQLKELLESRNKLEKANTELRRLEFDKKISRSSITSEIVNKARNSVIEAVYAGEALLMLHKRLALTEACQGFLYSHDILEHWDRYVSIERVPYEVDRFTRDVELLLEGYERLLREDERLLVEDLQFPEELQHDFVLFHLLVVRVRVRWACSRLDCFHIFHRS